MHFLRSLLHCYFFFVIVVDSVASNCCCCCCCLLQVVARLHNALWGLKTKTLHLSFATRSAAVAALNRRQTKNRQKFQNISTKIPNVHKGACRKRGGGGEGTDTCRANENPFGIYNNRITTSRNILKRPCWLQMLLPLLPVHLLVLLLLPLHVLLLSVFGTSATQNRLRGNSVANNCCHTR